MKYSLKNEYKELLSEDSEKKYFVISSPKDSKKYIYSSPDETIGSEKLNVDLEFFIDNDITHNIETLLDSKLQNGLNNKLKKLSNDNKASVERAIALSFCKLLKVESIKEFFNTSKPVKSSIKEILEKIIKKNSFQKQYFYKSLIDTLSVWFKDEQIEIDKIDIKYSNYFNDGNAKGNTQNEVELNLSFKNNKLSIPSENYNNLKNAIAEFLLSNLDDNIEIRSDDIKQNRLIISNIINSYSDSQVSDYILDLIDIASKEERVLRISPKSNLQDTSDIANILNGAGEYNKHKVICDFLRSLPNKGGKQSESKGAGEAAVHLRLNTSNVLTSEEPDAIIRNYNGNLLKCSIKSFKNNTGAQTGTNLSQALTNKYNELLALMFKNEEKKNKILSDTGFTEKILYWFIKANYELNDVRAPAKAEYTREYKDFLAVENAENINIEKIKSVWNDIKLLICQEHGAQIIICHYNDEFKVYNSKDKVLYKLMSIQSIPKNKRIAFKINKNESKSWIEKYFDVIEKHLKSINSSNEFSIQNSSYKPQGKVLKEVYSYLFKKELVNEGGKAGHMMHPYENLDKTPRDMMDRIESYGVPQKVIDKVDGQNLFFTVERDGTLLFSRNKQDMTHQDLVNKFTDHGAEAAFVEGGDAIKSGVEQWLGSAGNFAEQEILDIFHPTEDIRSFINFEIMHPKVQNQIQYDKKYVVFHTITDFDEGGSKIFSSNQDDRLKKLIGLMNSGVASAGFKLASNREIELNALTNVQIIFYTDRIRDLVYELGMEEDEFLADGVLRIIDKELVQAGINLKALDPVYVKTMRDFVLYGEDTGGDAITSRDFTKHIPKEVVKKLKTLGLTNLASAKAKVRAILSPFKEIFVDLGIDLLKGVRSAYLSPENSEKNIIMMRDKLQTAIEDYDQYMISTPESELSKVASRLKPHVDKIKQVGIDKAVSTSVEGGVYTQELDLEKITGGFAPMNQIVGAAYRDKEGIFPTFKEKFMQQESNRRSLRSVFNLIY